MAHSTKPDPVPNQTSRSSRWILLTIIAAGLLTIGAGLFVMYFQEDPAVKEAAHELNHTAQRALSPKAKIPRPPSLDPAQFKDPNVQAAYAVARSAPELLEKMPCYCGCFTTGHTSNYDCFVDQHGVTWPLCRTIALEAHKKYRAGLSIDRIKTEIDQQYSGAHSEAH